MSRPSWDETWMEVARVAGARSLCDRAKVGSVIVTADNQVVSTGYNGPPPEYDTGAQPCTRWCERQIDGDTDPAYHTCPSNHSEANAIARADWSRMAGGTIFITGAPCMTCAKLVAAARIKRLVYLAEEGREYRDPVGVELFLNRAGVDVNRMTQ